MTGAPSERRSGAPRLVISPQSLPAPNIAKIFHLSQGLELIVSSTHGQPTAVDDSTVAKRTTLAPLVALAERPLGAMLKARLRAGPRSSRGRLDRRTGSAEATHAQ